MHGSRDSQPRGVDNIANLNYAQIYQRQTLIKHCRNKKLAMIDKYIIKKTSKTPIKETNFRSNTWLPKESLAKKTSFFATKCEQLFFYELSNMQLKFIRLTILHILKKKKQVLLTYLNV